MKKTAALILALILSAGALSACKNKTDDESSSGKVEITLSQSETETSTVTTAQETKATETTTTIAETTESSAATTEPEETETTSAQTTAKSETTTSKSETTAKKKDTATTTTKAETKAPQKTASFSDADASVISGGATITIGADFSSARSKLGDPDSKQENPNCITGSTGYTYIYGGMTVNVYVSGGKEYVEAVSIDSGSAKTAKGIALGAAVSSITNAYGKANTSEDFLTEYKGKNTTLVFYTENGKVTGIFITKNY